MIPFRSLGPLHQAHPRGATFFKVIMISPRTLAGLASLAALAACSTPGGQPDIDAISPRAALFERFSYEGRSQETATPSATQYRNPILSGYYPDPSVLRVEDDYYPVSYTHLRAHATKATLVCRLLLEKKKNAMRSRKRSISARSRSCFRSSARP